MVSHRGVVRFELCRLVIKPVPGLSVFSKAVVAGDDQFGHGLKVYQAVVGYVHVPKAGKVPDQVQGLGRQMCHKTTWPCDGCNLWWKA